MSERYNSIALVRNDNSAVGVIITKIKDNFIIYPHDDLFLYKVSDNEAIDIDYQYQFAIALSVSKDQIINK